MRICRIEGSVHATVQDPPLAGKKLLLAQPVGLDGRPDGPPLIAVDRVDAGVGDLTLVTKEGGGARIILDDERIAVQCVVVAVIDDINLNEGA